MSSSSGQDQPAWCWPCGSPASAYGSHRRQDLGAGDHVSRLAVQARTLELYRQVGLADAVVARGRQMGAINLWSAGRQVAHAVLRDIGAGISPFPFALIFPQDEHERLLIDRLREAGVEVERQTAVLGFEETEGRVVTRLAKRRWCDPDVRDVLYCRLRRRPFDGPADAEHRVSGRHLRAPLLRGRRERAWPCDERRAARRLGYQRLPCGVSH